MTTNFELYRRTSIGSSLIDTLDHFVNQGKIEPQAAYKMLMLFDDILPKVMADKVKARMHFKGHLDTYRFCDEVWTFMLNDVNFRLDNQNNIQADKIKIVACVAKKPGDEKA
ncbi:MAG: hypothetical protein Q9195_006382 [Heterodermia aff. obscurata]